MTDRTYTPATRAPGPLTVGEYTLEKEGEDLVLWKDGFHCASILPLAAEAIGRLLLTYAHEQGEKEAKSEEPGKPAPDAYGWINHTLGECPVDPNALVDVRWSDGMVTRVARAERVAWEARDGVAWVIAYRVVAEPETPTRPEPDLPGGWYSVKKGEKPEWLVDETLIRVRHRGGKESTSHHPTNASFAATFGERGGLTITAFRLADYQSVAWP